MYSPDIITDCLYHRIGFRPPVDSTLAPLDADVRISKSGIYAESGHALVTIANLQECAPQTEITDYPVKPTGSATYKKGEVYYFGTVPALYEVLKDATGVIAVSDTTVFLPTTPLSVWLRQRMKSSIQMVVSKMVIARKLEKAVKTLLTDASLYNGVANIANKELKESRFVAYQFTFKHYQSLAAVIDRIGTQFSAAGDAPTIYLYHTSMYDPVAEYQLADLQAINFKWNTITSPGILLQNSSDITDTGGVWFLGYYEDDLPTGCQALNKTGYNFQNGPCVGCNNDLDGNYGKWSRYMSILPVSIPQQALDPDRGMFDWSQAQYYPEGKTWGLNLHLSINCDISAVICRQQALFDQAILLQFTSDMLTEIANGTRVNRIQEITKTRALFALDDRAAGDKSTPGIINSLAKAIQALDFDMSDIDGVCQACSGATGVNYTSI